MKVALRNVKSGNVKSVGIGWNWTMFLFSGLFGIPLFTRRLYLWGGLCLALSGLFLMSFLAIFGLQTILDNDIANDFGGTEVILQLCREIGKLMSRLVLFILGISIYLGLKGNQMTARKYVKKGWVFVDPDSDVTKMAKLEWGVGAS